MFSPYQFDVFLDTIAPIPVAPISNMDWLGPVVTSIGAVLVAGAGGISLIWRRRQDRRAVIEDKDADALNAAQPKITDGWEEVRQARLEATTYYNLYRTFENLFYTAFSALRHLSRSVRDMNPDHKFDKDIVDALGLIPPDTKDAKS